MHSCSVACTFAFMYSSYIHFSHTETIFKLVNVNIFGKFCTGKILLRYCLTSSTVSLNPGENAQIVDVLKIIPHFQEKTQNTRNKYPLSFLSPHQTMWTEMNKGTNAHNLIWWIQNYNTTYQHRKILKFLYGTNIQESTSWVEKQTFLVKIVILMS